MSNVYRVRGPFPWHARLDCTALDDEKLHGDGAVFVSAETGGLRPCLVCAVEPATEWVVTADRIGELLNLIELSKPYRIDVEGRLQTVGLGIREQPGLHRQVALFGDTVRLVGGRYVVVPQEGP